jgi:large subunit ribosomal protein L15
MPLQRRLPKRGFHNNFRRRFEVVNLGSLQGLPEGAELGPLDLVGLGLARPGLPVKLLAKGEPARGLRILVHAASKAAVAKVGELAGTVTVAPFRVRGEGL